MMKKTVLHSSILVYGKWVFSDAAKMIPFSTDTIMVSEMVVEVFIISFTIRL